MFIFLAICTTCACHFVIFISEESLFVDVIKFTSQQKFFYVEVGMFSG